MSVRRRYALIFVFGILALCLLAGLAYNLPPIHDAAGAGGGCSQVCIPRLVIRNSREIINLK